MTEVLGPLHRLCPTCMASAGKPCTTMDGVPMGWCHHQRFTAHVRRHWWDAVHWPHVGTMVLLLMSGLLMGWVLYTLAVFFGTYIGGM